MWTDGRDLFSSSLAYKVSIRTQNDRKKCTRNKDTESNSVSFRYAVLRAGPRAGSLGRSPHSYVCWLRKWLIVYRVLYISSCLRLLNVCPRILYAVVYLTTLSVNQLHGVKPMKNHGSYVPWPRIESDTWTSVRGDAARLPLDDFSWKMKCEHFPKICRKKSSFIKIWQEHKVLYTKTNTHLI